MSRNWIPVFPDIPPASLTCPYLYEKPDPVYRIRNANEALIILISSDFLLAVSEVVET